MNIIKATFYTCTSIIPVINKLTWTYCALSGPVFTAVGPEIVIVMVKDIMFNATRN